MTKDGALSLDEYFVLSSYLCRIEFNKFCTSRIEFNKYSKCVNALYPCLDKVHAYVDRFGRSPSDEIIRLIIERELNANS